MIVERATESYRFTCVRCDHWWCDDYEVRELTDADGETCAFYAHGGLACEAPVAADTLCPRCRCGPVHVLRLARVAVTLASDVRPGSS